jgi:hypothetical protein
VIPRARIEGLHSNLSDGLRVHGWNVSFIVPLNHEIREFIPISTGEKIVTMQDAGHDRPSGLHILKCKEFFLEPIAQLAVRRSRLHLALRLTALEINTDPAAVVGGGNDEEPSFGPFSLTRRIVETVNDVTKGTPHNPWDLKPDLSHRLDWSGDGRRGNAIETAQHGIKSRCSVVARSDTMRRKDEEKGFSPQRVDNPTQTTVNGLIDIKQRIFPKS